MSICDLLLVNYMAISVNWSLKLILLVSRNSFINVYFIEFLTKMGVKRNFQDNNEKFNQNQNKFLTLFLKVK